ncbi:MAG: hypothetical protein KAG82_00700 [Alcanivoracaceae bacterium]|nr:hypothetical protein [Alcanivoracaceae bacterium]
MNKIRIVAGMAAVLVAVLIAMQDEAPEADAGQSIVLSARTPENAPGRSGESLGPSAPTEQPEQSLDAEPSVAPENPMQEQLAEIASAYQRDSRFPTYSQPLTDNDWSALNPRAFVPEERPLSNAPSLRVSIELPHYIVDSNRELPVQVIVVSDGSGSSAPPLKATSVQVLIRSRNASSPPVLLVKTRTQGNVDTFAATIPATALSPFANAEVEVAALLALSDGQSSSASTMIQLFQSTASLDAIGAAYTDGTHLFIPVFFQVMDAGMYRVQTNLFTQAGEPVAHLNSTFTLSAGNVTGLLKVHATTLTEQGLAGPYVLTDINLMRMPAAPGEQTRYGSSQAESYPVNGFPLDSYSDEPYQDPAAQQRLEFLEKLSADGSLP